MNRGLDLFMLYISYPLRRLNMLFQSTVKAVCYVYKIRKTNDLSHFINKFTTKPVLTTIDKQSVRLQRTLVRILYGHSN